MSNDGYQRRKLNVCMLAYSQYESDARVRRYAESLARRGDHVDVLSLMKEHEKNYLVLNGVHIYGIQGLSRDGKHKFVYLYRMLRFLLSSSYYLTRKHLKTPYDLVHVHSVPDFEVFASMLPKLFGSKVILDIHDPVPDFFLAKFGSKNMHYYKLLCFVEWISTRFSDHVITVTDYWMEKIAKRSKIQKTKISVILNLPDITLFNNKIYERKQRTDSNFILLYPGSLNKHCGLDLAIKAVKMIREDAPLIEFHIYGFGSELENLKALVDELGLPEAVVFHGAVSLDSIPAIMQNADAGIALLAGHDDYAEQALNVKLFEYLSMGLPAIATRTKSIEYYIGDGVVMLSEPNSIQDVATCLRELYVSPQNRRDFGEKGLEFIKRNNSEMQMQKYLAIVDRLTMS